MVDNLLKFVSDQFRIRHNGLMQVLITNSVIILFSVFLGFLLKLLGYNLFYKSIENLLCMPSNWSSFIEQPWSILTHLLIQKNFWAIIWGMMLLYTFGTMISKFLGKKHFIPLYIFGGITGAATILFFYNIFPRFVGINVNIYGVDSCVYAVITAAATAFPNFSINLFLIGNVKLKYTLWFFLFLAFYGLDEGQALGICQLGGALGGFLYVKYTLISKYKSV